MAITSAPQRSGRTAPGSQWALIVTIIAVVLAAIGGTLLVRSGWLTNSRALGSGNAATQSRDVAGFTSIDLAGSNNVIVVVGRPESVVVHADSNLISHITTRVVAGTLVIGDTGSFTTRAPTSVNVSVPSLAALHLSGAGQISVTGISTRQLTVTVSGDGQVSAAGTVSRLGVTLSGDGQAQLSQLIARDVHAVVAGSGLIQVTATASLNAAVPGTGEIIYGGNPVKVTTSITGTGVVTRG